MWNPWVNLKRRWRRSGRASGIGDHMTAGSATSLEAMLLKVLKDGVELEGRDVASACATLRGRPVAYGQMVSLLDAMERRGLLTSRLGGADIERAGHRSKYYRLRR